MVGNGKNLSHFDGTKCFMSWSSKDAASVTIVIVDRLRHENENFTESVVDAQSALVQVMAQYKTGDKHNIYVIMGPMASQITSLAIVYSTVYSGADQRKHQSSASLAFLWGIHRWRTMCDVAYDKVLKRLRSNPTSKSGQRHCPYIGANAT